MTAPLPEAIQQLSPHVLLGVTLTAALTAVIVVAAMIAVGLTIYARACRVIDEEIERGELKVIANREGM